MGLNLVSINIMFVYNKYHIILIVEFAYKTIILVFQSTVGIIAGMIGTGQVMMAIPYTPGFGAKQAMWLVNCGMLGLAVAPIGALGGAIMIRAGWYTAGILFIFVY